MKTKTKRIAAATVAVLALSGCRASTTGQQMAVHETGAWFIPTSKVVKDCVKPGKSEYIGLGDTAYVYPSGQRSFTFGGDGSQTDYPSIAVVSKDNVTMQLSGVITFYMTDDCDLLKDFHNKIGAKRWNGLPAYEQDDDFVGFGNMLDVNLGRPAQNTLTDTSSKFNALALYNSSDTRKELQTALAQALPATVKGLTGGDYFGRFSVLLNKPEAPTEFVKALEARETAVQQNAAQAAINTTALSQYDQVKGCVAKGLSEASCTFLYAINSGKVPYVTPPGGSAVVSPQQPAGPVAK